MTCYDFIPEYDDYLKPMFAVDEKEEDLMEFKAKLDRIGMKDPETSLTTKRNLDFLGLNK